MDRPHEKSGIDFPIGYLNYNAGVQKQWCADIPGVVAKAEKNWPQVSKQTKIIE
jgi:hypothetical protein